MACKKLVYIIGRGELEKAAVALLGLENYLFVRVDALDDDGEIDRIEQRITWDTVAIAEVVVIYSDAGDEQEAAFDLVSLVPEWFEGCIPNIRSQCVDRDFV